MLPMGKTVSFVFILALSLLLLAGCRSRQATPVPPSVPTSAAVNAPTAAPAATLSPTETPAPPATSEARAVPPPVDTPPPATIAPTATSEPPPTPEAIDTELFLQLVNPPETEVFVSESSIEVVGRTRVDAVVTVNDTLVEPNIDGRFSLNVDLEEGPNIIEVVASVASGEQEDLVLVVIYLP